MVPALLYVLPPILPSGQLHRPEGVFLVRVGAQTGWLPVLCTLISR